jgi:hypothetical protein
MIASLQVGDTEAAAELRASRPLGRSYLPGHEEETFHPRINPRSHALHRPGEQCCNTEHDVAYSSAARLLQA